MPLNSVCKQSEAQDEVNTAMFMEIFVSFLRCVEDVLGLPIYCQGQAMTQA
jgi:hypothetical protein